MEKISDSQKNAISARIEDFPSSGIDLKLSANACKYYQSFHGKDFKALAQIALFILWDVLTVSQRSVWLALSQMFYMIYCAPLHPRDVPFIQSVCEEFVSQVKSYKPCLLSKPKIHLLLHLSCNIKDFGPASCFNTERCEAFNKLVKLCNIHSNKHAPSRDIATKFMKLEHLRFMCSSGRCGQGVAQLLGKEYVTSFLSGTTLNSVSVKFQEPGKLLKNRKTTMRVADVGICVQGKTESIHELRMTGGYNWASDVSLTARATIFGAVIAKNNLQARVDDYVCFGYGDSDLHCYGELKACLETENGSFCVIQLLYSATDESDNQLFNEKKCPLYTSSTQLLGIASHNILSPVSIVHECQASCQLKNKRKRKRLEREEVPINRLVFEHDYKDDIYALNIYCMHTITP